MEEQGKKYDSGKLEYSLLSPSAMEGLIKILMLGKIKYGSFNWARGINYSRVFNALQRHLWSWYNGEELDPESGESHIYHVFCNTMFLSHFVANKDKYLEFDDRPCKLKSSADNGSYNSPEGTPELTLEEIENVKEVYAEHQRIIQEWLKEADKLINKEELK